jgi:hypothetical protein
VEDVGHLGGMEVAGRGGCGLAAGSGCHGASLSCGGVRQRAGPAVDRGCSTDHDGEAWRARRFLGAGLVLDEQDDYSDQAKHPP